DAEIDLNVSSTYYRNTQDGAFVPRLVHEFAKSFGYYGHPPIDPRTGKPVSASQEEYFRLKLEPIAKQMANEIGAIRNNAPAGGMMVVSLDGGSGSGKTTIAEEVAKYLLKEYSYEVLIIPLDLMLKERKWRLAIEKIVTGRQLGEKDKELLGELQDEIKPRQPYFGEEEFFDNTQTLRVIREVAEFRHSAAQSQSISIPDAYIRGRDERQAVEFTLKKGTVIIFEGKYANREEFAPYYDLRYRLHDASDRTEARFQIRSRRYNPNDADMHIIFYNMSLVPSYEAYDKRTEKLMHAFIDLRGEDWYVEKSSLKLEVSIPEYTAWSVSPRKDILAADDLLSNYLVSQRHINLSSGAHTIIDFGIGLWPYATVKLADRLSKFNNNVKVIGVDRIIPSLIVRMFTYDGVYEAIYNQKDKLEIIELPEQEAISSRKWQLSGEELISERYLVSAIEELKRHLRSKIQGKKYYECDEGKLIIEPYKELQRENLKFVESGLNLPESFRDISIIAIMNVLMFYEGKELDILQSLCERLASNGIIIAGQRSLANHWINAKVYNKRLQVVDEIIEYIEDYDIQLPKKGISSSPMEDKVSLVNKNLAGILSRGSFVCDITLEAFLPEIANQQAQQALAAGGLGFLAGETFGSYSQLGIDVVGLMPCYAYHKDSNGNWHPIDWNKQEGVDPLIVKIDGRNEQLKVKVELKNRTYTVYFYIAQRNGIPVLLAYQYQADNFNLLYPEEPQGVIQFAFMGKVFVELFKVFGVAPEIIRLNEPQLLFVEVARQNDIDVFNLNGKKSIYSDMKVVLTTHTPERVALPVYDNVWWLKQHIGEEMVPSWIVRDGKVDMARRLAERAFVINGVSNEHKNVTKLTVLPEFANKTTAILNGSDPKIWKSRQLQEKEIERKAQGKEITGEDLFAAGQSVKKELNEYLNNVLGFGFADLDRPLVGLVRRLVAYKEQGILFGIINRITGDRDKLYDTPQGRLNGLGMNLLVGGVGRDRVGAEWVREFKKLTLTQELKGKFIFIDGSGVEIMRLATQASDVWASMPRPTREACGTSDQRAAFNGHPNIATATGGPLEYIKHGVKGWLMDVFKGTGYSFENIVNLMQLPDYFPQKQEIAEFYRKMSQKLLSEYLQEASRLYYNYTENADSQWLEIMKSSYEISHQKVGIERMVKDYHYLFELARLDSKIYRVGNLNYEKMQNTRDLYKVFVQVDSSLEPEKLRVQLHYGLYDGSLWQDVDMVLTEVINGNLRYMASVSLPALSNSAQTEYGLTVNVSVADMKKIDPDLNISHWMNNFGYGDVKIIVGGVSSSPISQAKNIFDRLNNPTLSALKESLLVGGRTEGIILGGSLSSPLEASRQHGNISHQSSNFKQSLFNNNKINSPLTSGQGSSRSAINSLSLIGLLSPLLSMISCSTGVVTISVEVIGVIIGMLISIVLTLCSDKPIQQTRTKKSLNGEKGTFIFSTCKADYILYGGIHARGVNLSEKTLQQIDAVVLETGAGTYEYWTLDELFSHLLYRNLASKTEEFKKPIFFVDLPNSKFIRNKFFSLLVLVSTLLEISLIILPATFFVKNPSYVTLPLVLPIFSLLFAFITSILPSGKIWKNISSYMTLSLFFTPIVGFRSAITAEKIEEFVVPRIEKRKGSRPNMLIVYGIGHNDIKPYLQHKWLRKIVLGLHRLWGYFPYDKTYLNKIGEINFRGDFDKNGEVISDIDSYHHIIYSESSSSNSSTPLRASSLSSPLEASRQHGNTSYQSLNSNSSPLVFLNIEHRASSIEYQELSSSPLVLQDLNLDMFRDYDYRSTGPALKSELIYYFGLVWATMALEKAEIAGITDNCKVVLARDARKIEPEMIYALIAALRYRGLDVIYTAAEGPNAVTSYSWAVQEFKPLMSIFMTASHVSRPKDIIVRGFKVTMLNKKGGTLQSLTTREIKETSKRMMIDLIEHQEKIKALESPRQGSYMPANIDENCVRMNTLVGEIASQNGSLYRLAREITDSENPLDVLNNWEKKASSRNPLKGVKIVVEGAHTPSGNLAAQTFRRLGAEAILIHGDIQEVEGEHKADPSVSANLAELKDKMTEVNADFGIAFDLDGDRGAIIVPKHRLIEPGKFEALAPDNLIVVLLPYLIEKLGYRQELTGKKIGVIRDVLGTFGVNDMTERLGVEAFQTDAGYVFLKALRA
ncbi:MAG: hypothetical protein PHW54_03310, partial [Candidatus Omnitrophica bacterium]|nr:hypothetical protein [Candidatus Omnitrophota bacterium]